MYGDWFDNVMDTKREDIEKNYCVVVYILDKKEFKILEYNKDKKLGVLFIVKTYQEFYKMFEYNNKS